MGTALSLDDIVEKLKKNAAGSMCCFKLYTRPKKYNFDEQVKIISHHINDIVNKVETESKRKVINIRIGKTFAPRNQRTRAKFSTDDASTMRIEGLRSRWSSYAKAGFSCLVGVAAFGGSDVPELLADHGLDQELLALVYERAVERACRALNMPVDNPDTGGGGRCTSKLYASYLVYVAIKLEPSKK